MTSGPVESEGVGDGLDGGDALDGTTGADSSLDDSTGTTGGSTTGRDESPGTTGDGGRETSDSDSTGAPSTCGNGTIDNREQCDGEDLQGFSCAALGLGRGELICDPVTCTFDTSLCEPDIGPTSG